MSRRANRSGVEIDDLDNLEVYRRLDPSGLGQRLAGLPDQCQRGWQRGQSFQAPENWGRWDGVIVGGMGGSAIAGELVADLASLQRTVPISVVREFQIPFTLGEGHLVIVCSHSGNTEETLSLFRQAVQAGATVLVITGGGQLAQQARSQRVALLAVDIAGEPRSAVGHILMLLLGVLTRLALVKIGEGEVQAALGAMGEQGRRLAKSVPTVDNPAKRLAWELRGKIVLVYGGGILSGVARRWKTQLNENAKVWAFYETIPELLHNAVEAYGAGPITSEHLAVLLLQPGSGEERIKARYPVLCDLLQKAGLTYHLIEGGDRPALAQLLDTLLLGDYITYYLALLKGVNPSLTPTIALAKERLSALGLPI